MSAEIHLARFGNRRGAHTILADTGVDTDLLGKIVWHTDAPPNSPDVIEPFVSGYRLDETYVVQVSRPDETAARPGMVATVAAIVPVSLLSDLDLRSLLTRLADANAVLDGPLKAVPARLTDSHEHAEGAGALAAALLARSRAAWMGSGLADAISCLWMHLPPADRARLVFGAAFQPEGLPVPASKSSIVVVAIPARAAGRWGDWQIVSASSGVTADPARDALFGDDEGMATTLAHDLGLSDASFNHWRHIAAAADLFANVASLNHESTRALLQLLGLLQPAPEKGHGPKTTALARLAEITPGASFSDVRGLRGIRWQQLPPEPALPDLLAAWVCTVLPDNLRCRDFVDAAAEAITAAPTDMFGQTLSRALQGAIEGLALPSAAEAVLHHPRGADALTWLARHATSHTALDTALADAAETAGAAPDWVALAAAKHGLPRTHAMTVDASDPATAWQKHLLVVPRVEAADEILASRTGAVGTLSAALQIADASLADRAGRLIAEQPALLTAGDIADDRFRSVWAAATRHGADPWRIISPADAAGPLLALAVGDQSVDEALLNALSRTYAADLSDHPRRAQLWDRLPTEIAARFKTATAASVARTLRLGDALPEPQLQTAILAPGVLGAVAHDDTGQAVTILRVMPTARPQHAELVAARGRFTRDDATDLASLIVKRKWKRAAETIIALAVDKPDLRFAASQVGQLFSLVERLRRLIGFSDGIHDLATADEVRDALHDTAAHLYPEGPAENGVWEHAGGQNADLPEGSTGRHRWGLALDAVMRGQHGAPPLDALLDAMMIDYPNNPDLRVLAKGIREGVWCDR
jgi:hypothetical protein